VHRGGIRTAIARNAGAVPGKDAAVLADYFDRRLARTSADDAARSILRAVTRNRARSVVGLDAKALDLFVRVAGPAYQRVVALVVGRTVPAAPAERVEVPA
jgi:hypothetical protein